MPEQNKPTDNKLADYDAIKEARFKVPNQKWSQWKATGGNSAQQKKTAKRKTGTKKMGSKVANPCYLFGGFSGQGKAPYNASKMRYSGSLLSFSG